MNPSVQDELNQAPSHVPNKSGAEMVVTAVLHHRDCHCLAAKTRHQRLFAFELRRCVIARRCR
jgi:hypothetical protein